MPRITAIEPIKRQKTWYNIHFDNGLVFIVNDELILKYALKPGHDISAADIKIIRERGAYLYLKKKALEIIARKRVSEKELRRKLSSMKPPPARLNRLIDELKSYRFIDDYELAVALVRSQLNAKPSSRRYIARKLFLRGIPEKTAARAMAKELEGYDERNAALKTAAKKFKSVENLPTVKAKKRIADFLRSRGFDWDAIYAALDGLFQNDD